MKKLLLCLAFTLCCAAGFAQAQKFKIVADDNENLPYATVYINGQAHAVANDNAVLNIPREMLKVGDTISASYVGYESGSVVYDGDRKGGYVIRLNIGQMEKVTIFGRKETRKAFRQISDLIPLSRGYTYSHRFVIDRDGKEICRGNLSHFATGARYNYSIIYLEVDDKHLDLMASKEGITKLKHFVIPIVRQVFNAASLNTATEPMYINLSSTKVSMTAQKGRNTTFLLSRQRDGQSPGSVNSMMAYIDVDTMSHNVVESRMEVRQGGGEIKLRATYSTYGYCRYPNTVEATVRYPSGAEYNVDIYDTYIMKRKERRHRKFDKSNTVSIEQSGFPPPRLPGAAIGMFMISGDAPIILRENIDRYALLSYSTNM